MIAARKIGSPDRAAENHITDDGKAPLLMKKHHVARRVSRAVLDLQNHLANRDRVALVQPPRRRERLRSTHPKLLRLFGQKLNPEQIVFVRALDGQTESLGEFGRTGTMVKVRMGQQNFCQRQAFVLHNLQHLIEITARIDDGSLFRFFAPDDRAVLLEGCYRNDGYLHGELLPILA